MKKCTASPEFIGVVRNFKLKTMMCTLKCKYNFNSNNHACLLHTSDNYPSLHIFQKAIGRGLYNLDEKSDFAF